MPRRRSKVARRAETAHGSASIVCGNCHPPDRSVEIYPHFSCSRSRHRVAIEVGHGRSEALGLRSEKRRSEPHLLRRPHIRCERKIGGPQHRPLPPHDIPPAVAGSRRPRVSDEQSVIRPTLLKALTSVRAGTPLPTPLVRTHIDASGRGNYDALAQHEGLTTWCRGRAHPRIASEVRRAHRLPPKGHGPPTATT